MRSTIFVLSSLAAASLAVAACERDGAVLSDAATPAPIGSADLEAQRLFATRCVACHGPLGKGDGVAGAQLNPRPRDFTKAEWQQRVTDDGLRAVIVKGGKAAGRSNLMPANPDLADHGDVVDGLVRIVRGLPAK
jgi:mono/diheme cytochrome c family protein